jgi:chromosome segregation ATPase
VDARALADVRRLAERDRELAAALAEIRAHADEVEAVRSRAAEIEAFFGSYSDEETRRRTETGEAQAELDRRLAEHERAAAEIEAARDDEERAAAQRRAARAADRVEAERKRLAQAHDAEVELERTATTLPQELESLEARARRVSDVASPSGPRELAAWASDARAHLFVQAGRLETERERVIREASELGTMLLGEPLYGATAEQVQQRVEATAAS